MNPEHYTTGDSRRSLNRGWVEDNVFVALGLKRNKRREPLEDLDGRLQFFHVVGPPSQTGLVQLKVAFKRLKHASEERDTLQFDALEEIPCKGGKTIVVHSFRPQRPRANTSTGIRCGVIEGEIRRTG